MNMIQLNTLKPAPGSIKKSKRIGRGQGSGKGGTSTRGNNGAKSRSGYTRKLGFEGGQMPLQRRLPIYGFKNPNKVVYKPISLEMLQQLVDKKQLTTINTDVLIENGLLSNKRVKYKILGGGELKVKLEVSAYAFSDSALAAIEKLGGKAITLNNYA
jgi:large subunit ribosomal protein L15